MTYVKIKCQSPPKDEEAEQWQLTQKETEPFLSFLEGPGPSRGASATNSSKTATTMPCASMFQELAGAFAFPFYSCIAFPLPQVSYTHV